MNNLFVNSIYIRGIKINPRTIAARKTAAVYGRLFRRQATDRIAWEHETDLSGDTDYLERDWTSIEIEQWIDDAAADGTPVDEFIEHSRVV